MRTLAIGDIHGCTRALDTLLAAVKPQADDLIVTLGDYVDRGPDSRGAVDRLLNLSRTHRLVALRGNHDWMMGEARTDPVVYGDWLGFGGRETLASYAPEDSEGTLDDVPVEHWHFLDDTLVDWYETETHFFVHALAHSKLSLPDQPQAFLHWHKLHPSHPPHDSGRIMICGHTAQRSGVPLNLGHAICLDTWVYGPGWLTCLEIETGTVWQANQAGRMRKSTLEELCA